MASGTVTQRLRPLRFAFLVDTNDRAAVRKAIQLSSMQWGGMFNPIVPVFGSRLPTRWSREPRFVLAKPKAITDGYLEGFDPDYIVPLTASLEGKVETRNAEIITPEQMLGEFMRDGFPQYGVGVLELASHVADKEFKYVRQTPLTVILPQFARAHSLFLSAVFGDLLPEVAALLKQYFGRALSMSEPRCSVEDYPNLLGADHLFVRRMTVAEIDYQPRDATVYCMDATDPLDVVDYWNLRAAGFYVIPAPRQAFWVPGVKKMVRKFVEDNYGPHHHNPDYYFHSTFQVGRGITQSDVAAFVRALEIPAPEKPMQPNLSIRWWYPRLWDRWARLETEERVGVFFSDEREVTIKDEEGSAELRALGPSFASDPRSSLEPRFANELDYRVYGAQEPVAEVLPHGSRNLAARVARFGIDNFRLSLSGPVYLASRNDSRIFFSIPKAEHFMLCWFREAGWTAELSQAGRIAKQMLRRLGGEYGIHLIDHEGVVQLLDKHASEKLDPADPQKPRAPKWIPESVLTGEIDRILRQEGSLVERERYLAMLRERDVLRLGLQLHCPTCTRWLWKAIGDLDEQVECEHCLTRFSVSAASPDDRRWSFKPVGPFNVRDFAGGGYTSLLTWKFFKGTRDRATTPIMSVELGKDSTTREVDLALFCNDGPSRSPKVELVLVECKSYDAFEASDIAKMQHLGEQVPEAILTFAKLGKGLNSAEVSLLTRLVMRQRHLWKARKPHSAVLILTGTELFGHRGAPYCWEGKGGKFDEAFKKWRVVRTLRHLAEITQTLYLNVPDLHEWAAAERKKRQKKAPEAA
jgi:hypothetical protein